MARKKKQNYNEMIRTMEELQERVIIEKDRMAGVLASELDHDTALLLGDFSDAELRRVASLVFANLRLFVNLTKLDTTKAQQLQDAEDGSMVEGVLRCNRNESCCEVWDTETNQLVGRLHDGMCVDLDTTGNEAWVPVKIGVCIMDIWFRVENGMPRALFDGLRVRFHKSKA